MSSLYQIEKLDDNNYDAWKIHMKNVLVHCDLWKYTNGTIVKAENASAADIAAWNTKDEKSLATIILSCKSSQLIHIKNCVTSLEAWQRLKELYQPTGPSRKVSLFKQLIRIKFAHGQTMSGYLNSFCDIIDKLKEVEIKIPEEVLSIILLCSLPDSYESFTIAIETRDEMPTMNNLKIKLLDEERRRGDANSVIVNNSNDEVLFIKSKSNGSRKNWKNKKSGVKCFSCGKRGHISTNCTEQKNKTLLSSSVMYSSVDSPLKKYEWCLDSGATSHMCCDKSLFCEISLDNNHSIQLAADKTISASGIGTVLLNGVCDFKLLKVLYVPELRGNFLSVSKATVFKHSVQFHGDFATITDPNGKTIAKAIKRNDLFIIDVKKIETVSFCASNNLKDNECFRWHQRFGHLNLQSLKQLQSQGMVNGLKLENIPDSLQCAVCMKGKITVMPFPKHSSTISKELLSLVHTDICGPMRTQSMGGAKYFITFIDDRSRRIFVYLLKSRDEVFDVFVKFKTMVECETSQKIKSIRCDNGKEYLSNQFNKYLQEHGIQRQLTVEYTPQQNGVAERANRTLVEMARCMLIESGLPESLWGEAVNTAAYLRCRSPTKILKNATPFEVWSGSPPNVNYLKVFGSKAVALIKQPGRSKFSPKGKEYFMVGYSEESKAYRLYDKNTRRVIKSRDVQFLEPNANACLDNFNNSDFVSVEPLEVSNFSTNDGVTTDHGEGEEKIIAVDINDVAKSKAGSNPIGDDLVCSDEEFFDTNEVLPELLKIGPGRPRKILSGLRGRPTKQYNVLNSLTDVQNDPVSVQEALTSDDSALWLESMKKEYDSLIANKTWDLVKLPAGRRAIGCRWVFHKKRNENGMVDRYKSRLVAKGCSQAFGIDYNETFSPVVRYSTIRLILALAVEHKLLVHQMDVTAAYLNGELSEEIFMQQPEYFYNSQHSNMVCKLNKTIYGLKQSGRE